ncbi:MAG: CHAD domain-containing protein [Sphingobacteriales bacterium]|nr:MAG: CHAD domain-containing protein [Sphingobacteriales bacterium]
MIKIKKLKKQIAVKKAGNLFSDFLKQFELTTASPFEEEIHQLRVMVKKWRALLILASFTKKGNSVRSYFKSYLKLYKAAGKLRDCHNHYNLISNSPLAKKMHPFLELLQQQQNSLEKKFKFKCLNTQWPGKQKSIKKFAKSVQSINQSSIIKYQLYCIETATNKIKIIFENEHELHNLRKIIKQWSYNSRFLVLCGYTFTFTNQLLSVLDEIGDLIGQWQDYDVAIEYLQQLKVETIVTDDTVFNNFIENLYCRKADLSKEINLRLPHLTALLSKIKVEC